MTKPKYSIIEAGPEWADRYRSFCQKAYSVYYVRPEIGVTSDLYSEEVFATARLKDYYKKLFQVNNTNKAWLAVGDDQAILGGVAAHKYSDYCEIKAFYVDPKLKGRGIGHNLFEKVKQFAGSMPIQLDVVNYMAETIAMYKHWGFSIDSSKGHLLYPWENWPESVRYATRGIYMVKPGS